MNEYLFRANMRKKAKMRFSDLLNRLDSVIAVHYSCESFADRPDGASPRVTSIAIRNLGNGQTTSFSIHQFAEIRHLSMASIDNQYDILEKAMLETFYKYVGQHEHVQWVHWKMRDMCYGFPALAHRCKVLGGSPGDIHDSQLLDLSTLLYELFGDNYAAHPRLYTLVAKNKITDKDMLSGKDESEAFKAKEYVKLHNSTLRKVCVLETIVNLLARGMLKTDARWYEKYGGVIGIIREHWMLVVSMLGNIASILSLFF